VPVYTCGFCKWYYLNFCTSCKEIELIIIIINHNNTMQSVRLWTTCWFIYSRDNDPNVLMKRNNSNQIYYLTLTRESKPHTASPRETLTVTVATWAGHHICSELLPWITGPNVAHIRESHGAARSEIDSYSAQDDLITRQFFSYEGLTNNIPQTPRNHRRLPCVCSRHPSTKHTHTHTCSLSLICAH